MSVRLLLWKLMDKLCTSASSRRCYPITGLYKRGTEKDDKGNPGRAEKCEEEADEDVQINSVVC